LSFYTAILFLLPVLIAALDESLFLSFMPLLKVVHANTSTIGTQVGKGTVYVKAYLKSNGFDKCELDNIQLGGKI
jgi:hypothetical protein